MAVPVLNAPIHAWLRARARYIYTVESRDYAPPPPPPPPCACYIGLGKSGEGAYTRDPYISV